VLAVEVGVAVVLAVVAGFQHHVDNVSQRVQQVQEDSKSCSLEIAAMTTGTVVWFCSSAVAVVAESLGGDHWRS